MRRITEKVTIPSLLTLNPTAHQEQTFTYSNCGEVKTKLHLSERIFNCDKCGLSIDRDYNTALNIHAYTTQEARTLNLQVAGRLKARGEGSTGKKSQETVTDCETTLLGSEQGIIIPNAYKHSMTGSKKSLHFWHRAKINQHNKKLILPILYVVNKNVNSYSGALLWKKQRSYLQSL